MAFCPPSRTFDRINSSEKMRFKRTTPSSGNFNRQEDEALVVVAKCRLIDPTCPTWRARKNYSRLCAKYPHIMTKLGLTQFSAY